MDKNDKGYALISMTNGDVYYIDRTIYGRLMPLLEKQGDGYITLSEAKSERLITINVKQMSSVVVLEGRNHA